MPYQCGIFCFNEHINLSAFILKTNRLHLQAAIRFLSNMINPPKVIFLIILFCSHLPMVSKSQTRVPFKQSDVYRFADGVVYTYSNPARWNKKDFMILGGIVIATAGLSLIDEPVDEFWSDQDSKFLDGVERIGYHYGKPYSAFITTGGFYLVGLIINDRWTKDTGISLGVSLLTAGLLQTFVKDAIGRARPGTGVGAFTFDPFSGSPAYHSFPSGHMTVAFSISHILASRINNLPIKIFLYGLAGTTAIARQYSRAHWVSDLVFAGSVAWSLAETALKRIDRTRPSTQPASKVSIKLTPYLSGVSLVATFK